MANREQLHEVYKILNYQNHRSEALQNYIEIIGEPDAYCCWGADALDLEGVDFRDADFGAGPITFAGINFSNCDFRGRDFKAEKISLDSCAFVNANLSGAKFGTEIDKVDFMGADLRNTSFPDLEKGKFYLVVSNHTQISEGAPDWLKITHAKAVEEIGLPFEHQESNDRDIGYYTFDNVHHDEPVVYAGDMSLAFGERIPLRTLTPPTSGKLEKPDGAPAQERTDEREP